MLFFRDDCIIIVELSHIDFFNCVSNKIIGLTIDSYIFLLHIDLIRIVSSIEY